MADTNGPNQPVTITLERWRWEQILMCLDRYVSVLREDDDALDDIASDAEWANQLDAMAYEFRTLVNASGSDRPPTPQASEKAATFDVSFPPTNQPQSGKPWTADENAAVVYAYFWMLDEQEAFRDFNKRAKYRELMAGALHVRKRQSIEYKMRNISAVLQRHGLEWVEGLSPLDNVQGDLSSAIEEVLAERDLIARPSH
jgi:hypothetical protein